MSAEQLLDVLEARSGLVCAVGAGGKKTTLYRLATLHPGRVALTSTVFIPPFPKDLEAWVVRKHTQQLMAAVSEAAMTHRRVAYTQPSSKRGRFEGVLATQVQEIHSTLRFDVTFVKADGARTRLVKGPAHDEPQIPPGTTTVIPIVSARVLNVPLSERTAHRVEQIERVSGAKRGQLLTPLHLARLIADEQGLLKSVGNANVIPLINMVETAEVKVLAFETAAEALGLTRRFDRIVLACMRSADPIIQVVRR